ncbi:tRNA (adenosine(37)-N6)-threonylcarbamoyltransferase complex dimerization subunit type 1 TsaB [Membranihabitans marinus]|uniref:tRNA (adenosine(37)-N6)-threonylcarbamoyltransferase complex dimerization subunit type 1 TsaB n=1 Tax=Membranihabitans marinus TaxID=1227546 RepID=UPI001F027CE8|nr:tRNA (adenosine(37)-N6)-threonylcarbamoyltransferase complex dimerization subunit type 1 TsaB [Membranihabitans marinus]
MTTNYFLCIETSGKYCAVCLLAGEEVLAYRRNMKENQHGSDIVLLIEEVLAEGQISYRDLKAVAVNLGPGSYTSLRIGLATAKGLCYALDLPLIGLTGFDILLDYAQSTDLSMYGQSSPDYFIPMLDAGRMEVYTSIYDGSKMEWAEYEPKILDSESYVEFFDQSVCFVGDGVFKWWSNIEVPKQWCSIDVSIDVKMMRTLVNRFYGENKISNLFQTRPLYIKKPNITTSKKRYFV